MIYECEICGEPTQPMMLVGEYSANLCLRHLNEWTEFVRTTETYRLWLQTMAKRDALLYSGQYASAQDVTLLALKGSLALFGFAREWIAQAKRKATP